MNEHCIKLVKKWVDYDNVIEIKKTKLKDIQDKKKVVEDEILEYVEENDLKNLHINITDGNIKFSETKSNQMITQKYLKDAIESFFQNHTGSNINPKALYDYIMTNRETKTRLCIKRNITS